MPARAVGGSQKDVVCDSRELIKACDNQGHVNVETAFGNLAADALRWHSGADIALLPSADFGNHIQPGPVTQAALENALQRSGPVAVAKMSVKEIYGYLETGISYITLQENCTIDWENSYSDGYLQLSGIQVKYDIAAPVGERVVALSLADGTVLDRKDSETRYRVASTAELFSGGFGYTPVEAQADAATELDVVSDYAAELGTIGIPEDMGRTKLLGTREIFAGYGRMIGALIGVLGLVIVLTFGRFKKRFRNRAEGQDNDAAAASYRMDI